MGEAAQHVENVQPRLRNDAGVNRSARVKPANLIYSVDEVPPIPLAIVLGLQHVFVMSVGWIFVVVVATSIGASALETQTLIRMSMIASGLATILQAQTKGPIGSGYLCPFSCGPAYVSASILAGQVGGLPLLWGMTTFSGIFEALLSRVMRRLQRVFPPEVTGLVVALVGIELIGIGAPRFLGYDAAAGHLDMRAGAVALITLVAMLAPTLWSKSKLRLYPVLIGLFVGPAGIGKSRIIDEAALMWQLPTWRVPCDAFGGGRPYGPLRALARQLLGLDDEAIEELFDAGVLESSSSGTSRGDTKPDHGGVRESTRSPGLL